MARGGWVGRRKMERENPFGAKRAGFLLGGLPSHAGIPNPAYHRHVAHAIRRPKPRIDKSG
jgi:hypothetical protein